MKLLNYSDLSVAIQKPLQHWSGGDDDKYLTEEFFWFVFLFLFVCFLQQARKKVSLGVLLFQVVLISPDSHKNEFKIVIYEVN